MKTPRLDKEIENLQSIKDSLSPTGIETLNEYLAIKKALQPVEPTEVKKPHCWGKMDWILPYKEGEEPSSSICRCEFGARKCLKLTRDNNLK